MGWEEKGDADEVHVELGMEVVLHYLCHFSLAAFLRAVRRECSEKCLPDLGAELCHSSPSLDPMGAPDSAEKVQPTAQVLLSLELVVTGR